MLIKPEEWPNVLPAPLLLVSEEDISFYKSYT
jgi:hypothetical protein